MTTVFRIACFCLGFMCMIGAVDSFIADNYSQALVLGCVALMFNAAWTYHLIYQETSR